MSEKWVKKWEVPGSNGHTWIVSIDKDNQFGCSCPVWKFKRQECKHIIYVKSNAEFLESGKEKPEYVLASVLKPKFDKKKNKLYIPLIGIPDAHLMEATICYYMLKLGLTLTSIEYENKVIPLAVFIYHSLDKYLSELVKAGYRVAICEQLEGHPIEVEVATPGLMKVNETEIMEEK